MFRMKASKLSQIYEAFLSTERNARQIRSKQNELIASNKAGLELFGEKENPFSFLKETSQTTSLQKLVDAYCTGTPIEIEIQAQDRFYQIELKKFSDYLLICANDRTSDFKLQRSLENQLDFFRHVLSSFTEPVYLTDQDGNLIYVNQAFCTLTGISFQEALKSSLNSFISDNPLSFEGVFEGVSIVKTNTGHLSLFIRQKPFETNNCLYFYGSFQKYVPPALSTELELFQESPIPAVIIEPSEYKIIRVNGSFMNMLRQKENSFEQKDFLSLFSETTRDNLANKLTRLLNGTTKNERIELILSPEYGNKSFNAFIGFTTSQKESFIIYLIDASERKNLEMQFAHAQKMQAMGQLAGGVAHDFNNLLTAIIGYCDLILQNRDIKDPSFLDILQIKGNANKAAGLVGQLLTFSRKQPSQIQTINFHDAFVDISALLQRSIAPFVTLKTELKRNLGSVKIDPNQLTQIFLNLAVNAKDAMTKGGSLKITASKEILKKAKPCGNDMLPAGQYIKVVVADNGNGISAEHLPHIFEPFFTTKEGKTGSGTGLGLSTVYGIIKGIGGSISVDSEKGIGTTFILYLPRYDDKPTEKAEATPIRKAFTPLQTYTILLVDDEDSVRLVSARVLRNKGFQVIESANAEQALEELQNNKSIDLLITDMIMPGMDGETLIKMVKQAFPEIRAILMSGYSEDFARHGSTEHQDFDFLAKPFELNQLLNTVEKVIEKNRE